MGRKNNENNTTETTNLCVKIWIQDKFLIEMWFPSNIAVCLDGKVGRESSDEKPVLHRIHIRRGFPVLDEFPVWDEFPVLDEFIVWEKFIV